MTLNISPSGVICLVLLSISQHTKSEMPSFTNLKDMIGAAKFNTVYMILTTPTSE